MGLFAMMKRDQNSGNTVAFGEKILLSIDKCSFGIYLIHMIFVRLTMKEMGFDPFDYGAFGFIAAAAVYFAASFAIAYGLRKFRLFNFL